jgi:orotidine-5'-phosphate decarboxylase
MAARGPLCVGIDPHPSLLAAWGMASDVAGLERFARTIVEAIADRVAVLKPQSAFFEAYGSAGIAVLERVLADGHEAGALMLLDSKRGDIGSTMAGYATAYLRDGSPLATDALTVSPFPGLGSLQPAVAAALASGRGLFVLCRTSNPEGGEIQLARAGRRESAARGQPPGVRREGRDMTVSARIADGAAGLNAGAEPMGSVGLVVGATITDTGLPAGMDFGKVNGPLLAPGIGAQGASPADLRRVFGTALPAVLPTVSRSVLTAGPSSAMLADSVGRVRDEVAKALGA